MCAAEAILQLRVRLSLDARKFLIDGKMGAVGRRVAPDAVEFVFDRAQERILFEIAGRRSRKPPQERISSARFVAWLNLMASRTWSAI